MYWFQLHDKSGPIVINVSRCVVDIFTISLSYVVFGMAFTFGIVYILNIDHTDVIGDIRKNSSIQDQMNMTEEVVLDENMTKNESCCCQDEKPKFAKDFGSTIHVILWTIFETGQKKQFPHETIEQKFATVLYFIYQVFIIIILLNLLIAIMNATVQRPQTKRQLYWKFVRTSIWVEYFDENSMLPVPFSLLHIPWAIFKGLVRTQCNPGWMMPYIERKNSELPETCELSDEELEVRKSNIRLMRSLINRFKDKHKDYTEEWRKSELGDIRKNSSNHQDYTGF
jgi:hypothetical protein